MPLFEFDAAKSQANKAKHGIDFEEAQELWNDDKAIVASVSHEFEERWALIAKLRGKHWTAIYTWRGFRARLISVRRSRDYEVSNYEKGNLS